MQIEPSVCACAGLLADHQPGETAGPRNQHWPRTVWFLAAGFWLFGMLVQIWRLESLTATYDQALFLQELWSTAQGRPFESSLSSVLSGAVAVHGDLPRIDYLHLGQHANALTLLAAPLVVWIGPWALPLLQVSLLTAAGLVFWRVASRYLNQALALRLTCAYYLSGAVIGPMLENFHDLIWLPLLGFLVIEGLLERRWWQVACAALPLLLVREDSGLVLFSLGLWAVVRRPGARWVGAALMLLSLVWVVVMTTAIQPSFDSSLSDRFLQEKFGHLVDDVSGGTVQVVLAMLRRPGALLAALVSPPGTTLGFLLALSLPLLLVPLVSIDVALLVSAPLLVALLSQGRTALAVNLRYVLALVPGLYMGSLLWWKAHPGFWQQRWVRPAWTGALSLALTLALVGNPHRSLSAIVPDSFVPWVHVSPAQMLSRRAAALKAVALVPPQASVAADTPLLPLLARREVAIRLPNGVQYRDRDGATLSVDWVVAYPGYYTPMVPVFREEAEMQRLLLDQLASLQASGEYRQVHQDRGLVVLRRAQAQP